MPGYTVRWRHAEGSTVNVNDRSLDLTELSRRKRRLGGSEKRIFQIMSFPFELPDHNILLQAKSKPIFIMLSRVARDKRTDNVKAPENLFCSRIKLAPTRGGIFKPFDII